MPVPAYHERRAFTVGTPIPARGTRVTALRTRAAPRTLRATIEALARGHVSHDSIGE